MQHAQISVKTKSSWKLKTLPIRLKFCWGLSWHLSHQHKNRHGFECGLSSTFYTSVCTYFEHATICSYTCVYYAYDTSIITAKVVICAKLFEINRRLLNPQYQRLCTFASQNIASTKNMQILFTSAILHR